MAEELAVTSGDETLAMQSHQVVEDMIATADMEKVKDLTHMFNLLQAKKNALRMLKMGELVDLTAEQMMKRLRDKPDEFSHADLVNYLNATQGAMDKISKGLGTVDELPVIALQQNNVTLNMDSPIDDSSRERITDVVRAILAKQSAQEGTFNEPEILTNEVSDDVDNHKEEV